MNQTGLARPVYQLDDLLDYAEVEAEFPEQTKRFLRGKYESGKMDAYRGAGQGRLGHSTPRAALIYQHATEERAAKIADALDERRAARQRERAKLRAV